MSAHLHRTDPDGLAVGGPSIPTSTGVDTIRLAEGQVAEGQVVATDNDDDVVIVLDLADHEPRAYEVWVKPAMDVVGALVLLVLLTPILLAVAIGIRATLGKGILYRQQRVGRDGTPFTMLKFRSMIHDRRTGRADAMPFVGEDRRRTHKHPNDPRVTAFGDFIRRYSLDELPQLVNVLRGDLSLVGPRPELVDIVERYEPWQHRRHDVKPGLTGLWQVTERDREGRMHLCVETDLRYIRSLSLATDLRILMMTVPAVLGLEPRATVTDRA